MGKKQSINIKYDGYKFDITEKNPLFSDAKIYVMYHGENRNNSHIKKEDVDKAVSSIYNIPIVGEFVEDEDSEEGNNFGGHGGKLIIDDNGARFIQTTKPMGVIPESAEVYWETIKDEKDRDREYLVVEGALLWNRYEDAVNTLKSANFGQSMEIEVEEGFFDDEDGIYHITDFSFSAFCVLGIDDRKNGKVEPAFEDSKIITYSDEFSSELEEMRDELNEYFISYSKTREVETLNKDKDKTTEEDFDLETAITAVEKAEESKETTDIENARELVAELEDGEDKEELSERLDAIEAEEEDVEEEETEEDFEESGDSEKEGDSEEIEESEKEAEESEEDELDEESEAEESEEYKELKEKYNKVKSELDELREFKKAVEKEEHEKASIELFDRLGLGEEDVKDLDIYKYTIEELEEKCYSILGRKMAKDVEKEFSFEEESTIKTNKVDLSRAGTESKTTRYGNLFKKFSTK